MPPAGTSSLVEAKVYSDKLTVAVGDAGEILAQRRQQQKEQQECAHDIDCQGRLVVLKRAELDHVDAGVGQDAVEARSAKACKDA